MLPSRSITAVLHAGQSSSSALLAGLVCCIPATARHYTGILIAPKPPLTTKHLYSATAFCRHTSEMEQCCQALGSSSSASDASSCGCQHTMPTNNQDNHVAAGMQYSQHMQCCHFTTSAVATACSSQLEQQQATPSAGVVQAVHAPTSTLGLVEHTAHHCE
jgi:hypothetical protein